MLRASNELHEAISVLRDVRTVHPYDVHLGEMIVKYAKELKDEERAHVLFRGVLKDQPKNVPANLAIMDILIEKKSLSELLIFCQDLPIHRLSDPRLVERYAHALIKLDCQRDALRILDEMPAQQRSRNSVKMKLMQVYRGLGNYSAAITVLDDLLFDEPNSSMLLVTKIQILAAQGKITEADELCAKAIKTANDVEKFPYENAKIQNRRGEFHNQLELLEQLVEIRPRYWRAWLDIGTLCLKLGDPRGALKALKNIPVDAVEYTRAAVKIATIWESMGKQQDALILLDEMVSLGVNPNDPMNSKWISADGRTDLLVKYLDLLQQTSRLAEGKHATDTLLASLDMCSQKTLVDMISLGLRIADGRLTFRSVVAILDRQVLELAAASMLLKLAQGILFADELGVFLEQLRERVRISDQFEFDVLAASACSGAGQALKVARANSPCRSSIRNVSLIGKLLLENGRPKLAARYLRLCIRRWPNSAKLCDLLFEAYLQCGSTADCRSLIKQIRFLPSGANVEIYSIKLLISEGLLARAAKICEKRKAQGLRTLAQAQLLQLCLTVGDLQGAETEAKKLQQQWGPSSKMTRHFRVSHLGQLLDEARLYRRAMDVNTFKGVLKEDAIKTYFYPAMKLIEHSIPEITKKQKKESINASAIPKNIFQYWNSEQIPHEVKGVMQSWEGLPGFSYQRFSKLKALEFLRDSFGSRYEKAFLLANNVAEECDFLRLCLIYKYGGIYADADDRCLGQIDELLERPANMILFREPFGAIANNFFCAISGHPVLKIAIDLASTALLDQSKECTWSKTGPGLLTRATALFLSRSARSPNKYNCCILTHMQIRRMVCPHVSMSYKAKRDYWNAEDMHFYPDIRKALLAL